MQIVWIFQIRLPQITLKGLSFGDRIYNYINKAIVQDLTNNLCSYIEMDPDEPGYFTSFFKTKKTFPDYFKGKIVNLEDVTIRALNVLKEVDLIAAEDTRHTLKLLNHFEITKPLISYHRHNEETKKEVLIEKLKNGENIALVSDAGTPGICDPGEKVIKEAIAENIEIIPIPGACAFVNALICSGIDTSEFSFLGFLPINKKLRKIKLEEIEKSNKTMIIYEAPHKLSATLEDLKKVLEDRKIVIARELTKIHEEFIRGTVQEIITKVDSLKGEFVIIIEGASKIVEYENELNELSIKEHYKYYEKQGLEKKEIIKKIAKDRNVSKNEVYMYFVEK